jgi:hypothetical protein
VLEKVTAFRAAGAQWMFVWPVGEGLGGDLEQLHRFHDEVMTRVDG